MIQRMGQAVVFYSCDYALPKFTNILMINNKADYSSAIASITNSQVDINNSTIVNNSLDSRGTISSYADCKVTMTNCIICKNGLGPISGPVLITYSDTENIYPGIGNFSEDPLFVSGPYGDYYLSQKASGQNANSPCIDAGTIPIGYKFDSDPSWATSRTDGIFDKGKIDVGFHYQPLIDFALNKTPVKFGYKAEDTLTILVDLNTAPLDVTADIYLIVSDPDGNLYSGFLWNQGIQPVARNIILPSNIDIKDGPIVTMTIMDNNPPLGKSGQYGVYLLATSPGTIDIISNLASLNFKVE
jgi:hypothetical protein